MLKMPSRAHFWMVLGISTSTVGQTDLVFGVRSVFISRSVQCALCIQDYKFLCAGVMICAARSTIVLILTLGLL